MIEAQIRQYVGKSIERLCGMNTQVLFRNSMACKASNQCNNHQCRRKRTTPSVCFVEGGGKVGDPAKRPAINPEHTIYSKHLWVKIL